MSEVATTSVDELDPVEVALRIIKERGLAVPAPDPENELAVTLSDAVATSPAKKRGRPKGSKNKEKKDKQDKPVVPTVDDSDDEVRQKPAKPPETLREFYETLTWKQKREVLDRQIEIGETEKWNENNCDFKMLECWKDAVREYAEKLEGPSARSLK